MHRVQGGVWVEAAAYVGVQWDPERDPLLEPPSPLRDVSDSDAFWWFVANIPAVAASLAEDDSRPAASPPSSPVSTETPMSAACDNAGGLAVVLRNGDRHAVLDVHVDGSGELPALEEWTAEDEARFERDDDVNECVGCYRQGCLVPPPKFPRHVQVPALVLPPMERGKSRQRCRPAYTATTSTFSVFDGAKVATCDEIGREIKYLQLQLRVVGEQNARRRAAVATEVRAEMAREAER